MLRTVWALEQFFIGNTHIENDFKTINSRRKKNYIFFNGIHEISNWNESVFLFHSFFCCFCDPPLSLSLHWLQFLLELSKQQFETGSSSYKTMYVLKTYITYRSISDSVICTIGTFHTFYSIPLFGHILFLFYRLFRFISFLFVPNNFIRFAKRKNLDVCIFFFFVAVAIIPIWFSRICVFSSPFWLSISFVWCSHTIWIRNFLCAVVLFDFQLNSMHGLAINIRRKIEKDTIQWKANKVNTTIQL